MARYASPLYYLQWPNHSATNVADPPARRAYRDIRIAAHM